MAEFEDDIAARGGGVKSTGLPPETERAETPTPAEVTGDEYIPPAEAEVPITGTYVQEREAQVNEPNLIVGAGPVGLKAALDIAMNGGKAVLIEKRADFTRIPKVGVNPKFLETINRFINLIPAGIYRAEASDTFASARTEGKIAIKDLQHILQLCIEHGMLPNSTISIRERVTLKFNSTLTRLDDTNMLAHIAEEEAPIPFSNILIASGNEDVTSLLDSRRGLGGAGRVDSVSQPTHGAFAAVTMELPKGVKGEFTPNSISSRVAPYAFLLEAEKFGWEKNTYPYFYMTSSAKSPGSSPIEKHGYTGEIPQKILEMDDGPEKDATLLKWVQLITKYYYGLQHVADPLTDYFQLRYTEPSRRPHDDARADRRQRKRKLVASTFTYKLSEVQEPYMTLGAGSKEGGLFHIGDSAYTPNIRMLEGIRGGFTHATWATDVIATARRTNGKIDPASFQARMTARRKESRDILFYSQARESLETTAQWKKFESLIRSLPESSELRERYIDWQRRVERNIPAEVLARLKAASR